MCAVLVSHEDREPVVEVAEHREVRRGAHEEPNHVVVKRGGVAVGRIDLIRQDDLNALLGLVAEQRGQLGVGPLGDRQDPPGHQRQGLGVVDLEMLALDRPPAPGQVPGLGFSRNRPQKTEQTSHRSRPTGHS